LVPCQEGGRPCALCLRWLMDGLQSFLPPCFERWSVDLSVFAKTTSSAHQGPLSQPPAFSPFPSSWLSTDVVLPGSYDIRTPHQMGSRFYRRKKVLVGYLQHMYVVGMCHQGLDIAYVHMPASKAPWTLRGQAMSRFPVKMQSSMLVMHVPVQNFNHSNCSV
jgi:hypothetical protein